MLMPIAMKSILAILAIGLTLVTAFSGCVGGENTSSVDTTTGTDTTIVNETENQTVENTTAVNQTVEKTYSAQFTGTVPLSLISFDSIVVCAAAGDSVGRSFDLTTPTSIKITINYTSTYGNLFFSLYAPDSGSTAYMTSENDGGGQETIIVKQKNLKSAGTLEGQWRIQVFTGLFTNLEPAVQVAYDGVVEVTGCPVGEIIMT